MFMQSEPCIIYEYIAICRAKKPKRPIIISAFKLHVHSAAGKGQFNVIVQRLTCFMWCQTSIHII